MQADRNTVGCTVFALWVLWSSSGGGGGGVVVAVVVVAPWWLWWWWCKGVWWRLWL
jgi:hypothetical protein